MKKVSLMALAIFGAALVLGFASCSNASGGGSAAPANNGTPTTQTTEGGGQAATTYAITVTSGMAKNAAGTVVTSAAAGVVITIVANDCPDGKIFDKWTSLITGVAFTNETSSLTTFKMPASDVNVTANYKNIPPAPITFVTVQGGKVVGDDKFVLPGQDEYYYTHNYKGVFLSGRTVVISTFYICDHEVTQAEWKAVMGNNPSNWIGDDLPVDKVSWYDAITYCNKKSIAEGLEPCYMVNNIDFSGTVTVPKENNSIWNAVTCDFSKNGYRLPTEAEWEYAARGGKAGCEAATSNSWAGTNNSAELGNYAWYKGNSDEQTHEVKSKTANSLNLYDMCGNVYEWCWDWYNGSVTSNDSSYTSNGVVTNPAGASSGSYRVLRGGSWYSSAEGAALSYRGCREPYCWYLYDHPYWKYNLGFRVVRSVQ